MCEMRGTWKGGLAAGVLGLGCATALISASSAAHAGARAGSAIRAVRSPAGSEPRVVRARALPGDELLAGPVLLGHEAYWVEAGPHRLRVRALDLRGHAHTVFSTTRALGAPKNAPWPFSVASLGAGDGRLAFVVRVMPCSSSPAGNPRCPVVPRPAMPWDSSTVFAGPPGAIRPVVSVDHRCGRPLEPWSAAISGAGLIVDEEHDICPGPPVRGQLVLLGSKGGHPIRTLAREPSRCTGCIASVSATGRWVGFITSGRGYAVRILRVATGRTVFSLRRSSPIGDLALDPSGSFAFLASGPRQPCSSGHGARFAQVELGAIGQGRLQVVAPTAEWAPVGIAATFWVAFFEPAGRCLKRWQVALSNPFSRPSPVRGLQASSFSGLAFDGDLVAAAKGNVIEMTTVCRPPKVPVPRDEPKYSRGPTELISGMYTEGGVPGGLCYGPYGPFAATITVSSPNGAPVASRSVRNGHLAHILLAPGTYDITGRFAFGGGPYSGRVTVRRGYTVREDLFQIAP